MNRTYNAYIDGSSRGNPGPSACAFVLEHPDGRRLNQSYDLGEGTNNIAEYSGLLYLLRHLTTIFTKDYDPTIQVIIHADSKLLVQQMKGVWKTKNPELIKLRADCLELIKSMPTIDFTFVWVPRDDNNTANYLAQQRSK